jgi:F0F1-type ATP synthase membrane subunit c/vacuolar-type H+-ATPase subunit K
LIFSGDIAQVSSCFRVETYTGRRRVESGFSPALEVEKADRLTKGYFSATLVLTELCLMVKWDSSTAYLLVVGVLNVGLAVFISPERLAAVGLMDESLSSEIPLVRATTLLEIKIAKIVSLGIGLTCLLLAAFWSRISASSAYRAFLKRKRQYPQPYESALTRFATPEALALLALVAVAWVSMIFGTTFTSEEFMWSLTYEDGPLESFSAVLLLLASALALRVATTKSAPRAVRLMHGFLALLFFVMFGEEISWGQRIFGIETPGSISAVNVQDEFNLHNMFGYFFDHLFILCFFLWGCVVPLLDRGSRFFHQTFRAVGLPVPGFGTAVAVLLITLTQDKVVPADLDGFRMPEVREFLSAAAFLAIMVQSLNGFAIRPKQERSRRFENRIDTYK